MHRLAALPGGWNPDAEGVIFVEQIPAPLVCLSAADTDLQTLARAIDRLGTDFSEVRATNLLQLQQQLTIDTYAEDVLEQAEAIVLRLLGGRAYWSYGLEVVKETVEKTGASLIVIPGDDRPDPDLLSHSTVPLTAVNRVWRYFTEGGIDNITHALQFIADLTLGNHHNPPPPVPVPRVGRYRLDVSVEPNAPRVGVLFYRAHYLAGNTAPIDALARALAERGLQPIPLFVSSLRDPQVQAEILPEFEGVQVAINTTGFAIHQPGCEFFAQLDVPVLQAILSSGTEAQWESQFQGLAPRDMAMNVALPEVDGRIIARAISFKTEQLWHDRLETSIVGYQPKRDRVEFVAQLAANWVRLRQTPPSQRRIALILANYPNRDGRLANGVGLDTPASCVAILQGLKQAGYAIDEIPATGDELIRWLTAGVTNDRESQELRPVAQTLSKSHYDDYFATVSPQAQQAIRDRWDGVESLSAEIPIAGIQLGNVFVGIQPSRGYDLDPSFNYHSPDLDPPHTYLAFYEWLRSQFGAQAIAHVGKHGNLEWLPGKGVALSADCYPEIALGAIPHFYPFIVNDPGEGSQAKRRSQAVILDHLTPPMTRAELYGSLQQLERLTDEYYEAQSLDPSRLKAIQDRILQLIRQENLDRELGIDRAESNQFDTFLTSIDGYLCELKEAQIRDGLHVFGQCPQGRQLRDLIIAIARSPGREHLGLTRAIAKDFQLDIDPLTADFAAVNPCTVNGKNCHTVGDIIEAIEQSAAQLVDRWLHDRAIPDNLPTAAQELTWMGDRLLPSLQATKSELTNLLHGFNGGYIPSGAAGAPTRGRPDVLPTGRNFYSVDIRALPTETAWDVGRKAAEALVERYIQENGDYPQTLGLSVWGTSTMRTGGDDIAQALALIGVRPIWDGASRRVVDFEILPVSALGRPRVDVTLRISGFFRDAFANLIDLFDRAVIAVSQLPESPEDNPLAARVQQETQTWEAAGLSPEQAKERSRYRVFGSKPGAYGAGLQGLIDSRDWQDESDLARAYINWSAYAYTGAGRGQSAPEAFEARLSQMQVVLHNQDNREHDLLDSDDYYQFQGGLTAAVRIASGRAPTTYFGDHSRPENPKVRQLREEIARVYRSRVVNPKWIAGAMRHGYKGAFEMAATVDYLFAYDATAQCVEDYMYEGVTQAYLLDPTVREFVRDKNPWALRDMAERMLEARQRGMWQSSNQQMLEALREIVWEAEGEVERLM